MATQNTRVLVSLVADSAINGQYLAVKLGASDNSVVLASAGTDAILGIVENKPLAGEGASVAISGIAKFTAGAAVALGAQVTSDANGKLVTATTGDIVIGRCVQAAGAEDEIGAVLLTVPYVSL